VKLERQAGRHVAGDHAQAVGGCNSLLDLMWPVAAIMAGKGGLSRALCAAAQVFTTVARQKIRAGAPGKVSRNFLLR